MIPFSDLARAAYCPRQCYYARREDDRDLPESVRKRRALAFRYPELVDAPDSELRRLPIERSPAAYRRNLARLRERDDFDRLADPARKHAFVAGRDCHGVVHKVMAPGDDAVDGGKPPAESESEQPPPPVPVVVSPGEPPKNGVWEPQSVRAVATAKALAWEHEREVPHALVEYPTVGTVREVGLTTRKKAAYRKAVRTVRSIDGPPSRVADSRCEPCEYRDRCGTRRRSLKSLLTG